MKPLTIPASGVEMLTTPGLAPEALGRLNAITTGLEIHLVPQGNAPSLSAGSKVVQGDAPNLFIALPLQLSAPIADPTGGGTVDTQCRAVLAALLAALRATRQLPS